MEEKCQINISTFVLLLITVISFFNDCICYILNINYIISLFIATIGAVFFAYSIRKYYKVVNEFKKSDWMFFILLFIVMIICIPFPDSGFDTMNYHLYSQERPFYDKIFTDFFAGRFINTFTITFPDRIYYIFRYILGYRLGTIFNYLLVTVIYYLIKKLIKGVIDGKEWLISLCATVSVISLSTLEMINSYYVDILAAALLLLLLSMCREKKNNVFNNCLYIYVTVITFLTKISTSYFLIIFGVIYLINNWSSIKQMRKSHFALYLGILIIPASIYLIYNLIETGSPFFPFYNKIFHSKYYIDSNWMDNSYGAKNLIELVFWPIIAHYDVARSTDTLQCECWWAIVYVFNFINIIACIISKITKDQYNKKVLFINLFSVLLLLVWSKGLIGYTRYGLVCLYFGMICYSVMVINIANNFNIKSLLSWANIVVIVLPFIWNTCYFMKYTFTFNEYQFINYFSRSKESYKYNVEHLFDHKKVETEFPDKSAWGIIMENAGDGLLINDQIDIINVSYGAISEEGKKLLNTRLSEYDHIYTPVPMYSLQTFFHVINRIGWKIKDLYKVSLHVGTSNTTPIYIFEIEPGKENVYFQEWNISSKSYYVREYDRIQFNTIFIPYIYISDPIPVRIKYFDENKTCIKVEEYQSPSYLYRFDLDVKNYAYISIDFDAKNLEENNYLAFQTYGMKKE